MTPPDAAALRGTIHQLKVSAGRHGADGEDLVQEALTRAVANGVPLSAVPWLQTVTRRLAIDRARRSREVASGGAVDIERFVTEMSAGPEEVLLSAERRVAVRDALAALPERYQQALLAWAEDGPSAVAKRLGTSPGATWTLLSRARDRLRTQLERAGVVPAAISFRARRWWGSLEANGLALGAAAAIALPVAGPAAVAAVAPAKPRAVAPATVSTPTVVVADGRPAGAPRPAETVRAPVNAEATVPQAPKKTHLSAGVSEPCTDAWSPAGSLGIVVRDNDDRSTLTPQVTQHLPEQVRATDAGGC